jgi:hypothetical protein
MYATGADDGPDGVHNLHVHVIIIATLVAFTVFAAWKYRQITTRGSGYVRVSTDVNGGSIVDMTAIDISTYQSVA